MDTEAEFCNDDGDDGDDDDGDDYDAWEPSQVSLMGTWAVHVKMGEKANLLGKRISWLLFG